MRKVEEKSVGEEESPLDEIARRGAQRMIEAALEVEGSSTCRSCMSIATSGVAPRGAAGASRRGRGRPVAELDHPSGEHLAGRVPGVEEALGWMGVTSSSLVTHFDLPAEHWQHLRTTNPIESTFATVKLRQRVTKGAGSRAAGLAMAFKLLLAAERTWRRLNGHELLPLVAAGVFFRDGVRVERDVASDTRPNIKKGRTKKTQIEEADAA